MFVYKGCEIIENTCECRQEQSCIDPFPFLTIEDCELELIRRCDKRKCARYKNRRVSCPTDSEVFPGEWSDDGCCPQPDGCICKPCPVSLQCGDESENILFQKGNGVPGTCCDIEKCAGLSDLSIDSSISSEVTTFCGKLEGQPRKVSDTWWSDECTKCTCKSDGRTDCEAFACTPETCHDFRKKDTHFDACCRAECETYDYFVDDYCPRMPRCIFPCQPKLDNNDCEVCHCPDYTYDAGSSSEITTADGCPSLAGCTKTCRRFGFKRDPSTKCKMCKCQKTPLRCPNLGDCIKSKNFHSRILLFSYLLIKQLKSKSKLIKFQ